MNNRHTKTALVVAALIVLAAILIHRYPTLLAPAHADLVTAPSTSVTASSGLPAVIATGQPTATETADTGVVGDVDNPTKSRDLVTTPESPATSADAGAGTDEGDAHESPSTPIEQRVTDDPVGVAGELVQAIRNGDWRMAAALTLAILMVVVRRLQGRVSWMSGDRAGAVTVMVIALGGALAMSLSSEVDLSLALVLAAVGTAWTAVGGYQWVKRLIWPKE